MGRGKHMYHLEKKIQVNTKFTLSRLNLLYEHGIITNEYSPNKYINKLVDEDLKKRNIKE